MWRFGLSLFLLFLLSHDTLTTEKADGFTPVLLSLKGKVANRPTLVKTPEGIYIAWIQRLGGKDNAEFTKYFLAISRFDPVRRDFNKPWKALETNGWRRPFSSTLITLSPKFRQKHDAEPSFRIVLDKLERFEGVGANFWSGFLEPIDEEKKFKLTFQKEVLGHEYFQQPGKGGEIVQLQFLDRRPKKMKGMVYLLGSAGSEVWIAPFTRDGSLGDDPNVIYHSLQTAVELRVSGVIAPNDEFFVFIPSGRKFFRFIRSQDGKSWSKPEEVETTAPVEYMSSCVDDAGNIWVCYVSQQGGKNSLYLTRSKDMAKVWEIPILLIEGNMRLAEPCLAVLGNHLIVAYKRQITPAEQPVFGLIVPLADLKFERPKGKGQ